MLLSFVGLSALGFACVGRVFGSCVSNDAGHPACAFARVDTHFSVFEKEMLDIARFGLQASLHGTALNRVFVRPLVPFKFGGPLSLAVGADVKVLCTIVRASLPSGIIQSHTECL